MGLCYRGGAPPLCRTTMSRMCQPKWDIPDNAPFTGEVFRFAGSFRPRFFIPPTVMVRGVGAAGSMAPIFPRSTQPGSFPRISSHI